MNKFLWQVFKVIIPLTLIGSGMCAQMSFLDNNHKIQSILDRYDIMYGSIDKLHSAIRYNDRTLVYENALLALTKDLTLQDREDQKYIIIETPESQQLYEDSVYSSIVKSSRGFLGIFYKTPYSLVEVNNDDFYMEIDPVVNFSMGDASSDENLIFQNTRGIKLRGVLDSKVYFYSRILENQRHFLSHTERLISTSGAIPGQGFFKPYQSGIFSGVKGWDYLNAEAYLGVLISKSVNFQLGHGNNFIGNGIQSLLLQDYSHNYFYLKLNAVFWKIHYQTIFAELASNSHLDQLGNELIPKKYMAAHYVDFKINQNLSIGLFEAVVFGRQNHFEFQYLNPVILYRSVEQFLDSPDNVIIGLNTKTNLFRRIQIYSQIVFDEFKIDELFGGRGWWGNKVGVQVGMKYKNFLGVEALDVQTEYNTVRPYTYAHRKTLESPDFPVASYSHYNQPLAHPLGANFKEYILSLSYRPLRTWYLSARFVIANYGDDPSGINFGRNILKDYNTRSSNFGNFTAQGVNTDVYLFSINLSKEVFHNYYLDINYYFRSQSSVEPFSSSETQYFSLSFRGNLFEQNLDY